MPAKLTVNRKLKYRNVPVRVGGRRFASKREANRYCSLRITEAAGEITGLECQVPFALTVNGEKVCTYIADFRYWLLANGKTGPCVVEDAKGVRTEAYKIKKRLMAAIYRIDVKEI